MRLDTETEVAAKIKRGRHTILIYFFEGVVIYATVFVSMMWVAWHDIGLLGGSSFDDFVIKQILNESFFTTVRFFSAYAIVRVISYAIFSNILKHSQFLNVSKKQIFVIWTFSLSMLLIAFAPLRLILQDIILEPTDQYVTGYLAKFNFDSSIAILLTLGVIAGLLLYLFRLRNRNYRHWITTTPIVIGVALSFFNYGPDYTGAIYEARAAWKAADYELLFQKAELALSASETDQEKVTSYYWMAVSHTNRKQYHEAIIYHTKALELNPDSASVLSSLSYAQTFIGQYTASLETAERCIVLQPNHPWCYNAKAVHYLMQGEYGDAKIWYMVAVEKDPESRELRRSLEWVDNELRLQGIQ